jgi:hypothetical protein
MNVFFVLISSDNSLDLFDKEMVNKFHLHPGSDSIKEQKDDFQKLHEFETDNYNEITYLPAMMYNLNKVEWRRVDLDFNSNVRLSSSCCLPWKFAHDFMVKKATIPFLVSAEPGEMAVQKLIDIVICDHLTVRKELESQ